MITIYKSTEFGVEKFDELVGGAWINVVDPTTDEIEQIQSWGIPQDFLTYPLDLDERSRTEREDDGTLLVVLRVPYFQGSAVDVPYATLPLGMIMTDKYVITVCRRPSDILQELTTGRTRGFSTGKRNRFMLRVLLSTATKFLSYLREINKNVDEVEDRLQVSTRNKEVLELLKYQKSLVYFTTALKTNELMLERLQRSQLFRMYPDDEDLLEDVITENQQAIEMTNITINILNSLMDAFASIISNNLNAIMKFLASITVVLSLPTIITSFFGMNVPLPWSANSMAPMFILAMSVLISVLVTYVFIKRDWF